MTATILPSELVAQLKPDYVAPLVAYLCSPGCKDTGRMVEVGSGWMAGVRWQRSAGVKLGPKEALSVDSVARAWPQVIDFQAEGFEYPRTPQESFSRIMSSGKGSNCSVLRQTY